MGERFTARATRQQMLWRIRQGGLRWLLRKLLQRAASEAVWLLLLPVTAALHALGWRRLVVRIEHIGHLAAEPDCHLKQLALGQIPPRRRLVCAPAARVANAHLLDCWADRLELVRHPGLCWLLEAMTRRGPMREDTAHYVSSYFGPQQIYAIAAAWGDRPPLLGLSADDQRWADEQLAALGLPAQGWFVCFHAREGGFLPHNEPIQSHRNVDVHTMLDAMRLVVARGGSVIRMGDPSMVRLPPMPGVIDLAHHPLRSPRLDVVLCARCRFFVGCSSGLAMLAAVYGRPVAQSNMIPLQALAVGPRDLSIPKLLRWRDQAAPMPLAQAFAHPCSGFFFTHQYHDAGVAWIDNTAEDIRGLVSEMLDRDQGPWTPSPADEALQARHRALMGAHHYSSGAPSRLGADFLRRHAALLDEPAAQPPAPGRRP